MDVLWFVMMEEQWEQSRVEKVLMIAWAIWTNRNECKHKGVKKINQGLLQWSLDYLGEYHACSMDPGGSTPSVVVDWTPHTPPPPVPPNRHKINVDDAVFKAQKAASVGVLIRDAEGTLIGACSKRIMAPLGAIEVEAKAIEFGL